MSGMKCNAILFSKDFPLWDQLEKWLSVHIKKYKLCLTVISLFLILKKTSLARRASDGRNPLARSQNALALDYRTRLSLHAVCNCSFWLLRVSDNRACRVIIILKLWCFNMNTLPSYFFTLFAGWKQKIGSPIARRTSKVNGMFWL